MIQERITITYDGKKLISKISGNLYTCVGILEKVKHDLLIEISINEEKMPPDEKTT